MPATQLALFSGTAAVSFDDICQAAQVLQRQFNEHFTPAWGQPAVITPVERIDNLPLDTSPVVICDSVGDSSVFGLHMVDDYNTPGTEDDRPFALVEYQPNKWWCLDASHECLELILDPYGNQLYSGPDPAGFGWTVDYLVEICDPCGRASAAYHMSNSVWPVSDFVLPGYYDGALNSGGTFSRRDQLLQPRTLLPGGYLAWSTQVPGKAHGDGDWYMTSYDGQSSPVTKRVLRPDIYDHFSLRQWVDFASRDFMAKDARCQKTRATLALMEEERKLIGRHLEKERARQAAVWKKTVRKALRQSASGGKRSAASSGGKTKS